MDFSEADLQVFIDSVVHYFSHTTTDAAEVHPPYVKAAGEEVLLDFTGVIGISGLAKGAIYFTAESALLSQLLMANGMGSDSRNAEMLRDMVGEVANTMSGSARQHFGTNFLVSVPIVMARGQVFQLPDYLRTFVIPITWRNLRSSLIICLGHGSAVYGSLRDIPSEEVLGMAARGSSTLHIRDLPGGRELDLVVHMANLRKLAVSGRELSDALEARAEIVRLLSVRQGSFELIREPTKSEGPLYLPLKQLILSGMATVAKAAEEQANHPLPETVFVLTDHQDYWLEPETQAFLDLAEPLLRAGASANMIAAQTGGNTAEICGRLYLLLAANIISPMRAYARAARIPLQAVSPPAPAETGALPPVAPKPALVRLSADEVAPPRPSTTTTAPDRPISAAAEQRAGLVGRLLSGLKQRLLQN